jgi:hypothetical protein
VRAAGIEPAQALRPYRFSYHFGLWSGYPVTLTLYALGAARPVSTPSPAKDFGGSLARDCHFTGFPDFEQFCIHGFAGSTQSFKSVAFTSFATPATPIYSDAR